MNQKVYKQADSRWGNLPYPTKSYKFASNGCGCCSCLHNIIEIDKYKNWTPKDLRPYMVSQGFATRGHGTTWAGITKTLEHYGFTVSHPSISKSMSSAWTILNKSGAPKQGVLLFRGGIKGGVRWTNGGHYVAFLNYKVQNGKHYFYTKDSGGRHHDGWYCYETTMAGLLPQIWIVTAKPSEPTPAPTPKPTPAPTPAKKTYSGTIPTPTLKYKSRGSKVEQLQRFLNWYGGYGLAVDGKFGSKTKAAVKKFQKAQGLVQDGIYGPKTHAKAKSFK